MSEPTENPNPADYGAEQIQILEGLEPVRMRPGMYVGGTSATGLHHCVWEIVDNAVDEALAGHCTEIVVELDEENVMTVTDNGRGIPVAKHPKTGESALDVVFTRLHAGGKFGGGGYKVSGGLHGVGASVTNALSKWLEVEVRRDGTAYQARYERGKTVMEAKEVRKLKRGEAIGTTVRWRCDDKDSFGDEGIFDRGVHYSASTIERRLKEKSFLVRGLTFRLRVHGREEQVFHSKLGIADYVRELNDGRKLVHPKVMFFSSEDAGQTGEEDIPVEVALQWTQSSDERIYSFANVISTVDHGTHVTGMRRAITRALNQYAWDAGKLKKDKSESFDGRDVFDGLTAAVSVKVANPQFEGQTKGKLNNAEATGAVATFLYATFLEWMGDKANAKESKAILERCLLAREIRIKKSQVSKKLRNQATSIFADSSLPGKLADCLDTLDADEREIFIVEGDSAAGSGKGARDNTFQAILPIRGKILNTLVARDSKAFENAEIESILIALGGRKDVIGRRIVATLEADQRRYGKVVCMSVDGDELTFIKSPDGRIRSVKIGRFVDQVLEQGEDPQQYQVLCFDQGTHRTHFKRLEAAIRHPLEETLYEIRTRYGRSVRVTSSHSVYVWENEQATLKPGHEVRPGDLIVAPHVLPLRNVNAPKEIDLIAELAPLRGELPNLWLRGRSVERIYRRRADAARTSGHPIDAPRVRLPNHVLRRLTLRRQQLGLTQTAVATRVGVKQAATISEWETGRGNPSIAQLNALTDALGIDADAVMAHAVLLGSQLERLRRNGAASVNQRSRQAIRFAELSDDELELLGPDVVLSPEKHAEAAISRRLELSPELFFLVGAYMAEGSISERCGVRFSLGSHEHGFADEIARAASVAFGISARRFQPKASAQEIRLGSTAVAAVFTHVFGFADQKSRSKQVPDWVFNVGPQLQLEFLRGYFLGDGTRLAGSNSLSVTSASQQLINQLSYLLSAHGILATISAVQPQCSRFEGQTINSGPAWTLAVSGYKQMRMLERVWADDHRPHAGHPIGENGPVVSRRAGETEADERLTPEQIAELAGVGASRVRQAMRSGELAWQLPPGRMRRGRTSSRGDVELWLRRRANRSGVHQLLPGDLIGLPVVSVTPVEPTGPYVYDFSVEDDENFICGSGPLCCHNTDADTDGAHIANLLLALFHELFPQLLQEGRIFVAKPPLYRINLDPRGEKYVYAYSDSEREALVKKHRRSSDDVSRFKGLGEMNAEDLAETCFDPASRQLLQVTIDDAVEAAEALKLIMGRDPAARRNWLEEVGLED